MAALLFPILARADLAPLPADGRADATAAIQQRLDAAGAAGGEVLLPPGQYLLAGHLTVPPGVALRGSWTAPHHGQEWRKGTTLLLTGGRGQEDGPAAIELSRDAALQGVTLLWPEESWNDIQPYPWAVRSRSMHATVENVTLVNAYQGISIGQGGDGSLHLIRNVYGFALRRGVFVDNCTDIGRIENVHLNPHYWSRSGHPSFTERNGIQPPGPGSPSEEKIRDFVSKNLEAFVFARSDWEYVVDTFVWGAAYGYRFVKGERGGCNGQFLGIGADFCRVCVGIDMIQPIGLQVTNGEFTAFAGEPNSAIVTAPEAAGAAQFVNCNFWGVLSHAAWLRGKTQVTLSACHICQGGGDVQADAGRLIVQGCNFEIQGPAVHLGHGVEKALLTGNLEPGGFRVDNGIGSRAQIGLNEMP